jgi:hypothetical protein
MRVRVISQTLTDLWRNRDMLNPLKSGFFAVELISHKLLRYAVPVLLMGMLASSLALAQSSLAFAAIATTQVLFYCPRTRRMGPGACEFTSEPARDAAVFRFGESRERRRVLQILKRRDLRPLGADTLMPNDNAQAITKRVGRNVLTAVPRVSVVIPAYNSAATIEDTLASAIAQKYREHEIIVVNDGSPDTEEFERAIRTRLEDIVYIKQPNQGAGPARNTGIEHARAQLIAFLDADDIWERDYLASQYVHLNRNSLDMVYCDAWLFGTGSAYRRTFMGGAPSVGECTFDAILDLNVMSSPRAPSPKRRCFLRPDFSRPNACVHTTFTSGCVWRKRERRSVTSESSF